ncbi:MAG: nicotinate (nicotinamide) nucleotide adenylyltransferase [Oscillospiraceae bacterium]|nr:nicotinate (nicotinamide) nucleotide adenylyltransferase [Oscillospiraceae bacterium]
MRIAIYGGSFNPPHIGHVEAARSACEQLKPDRFLIIPTNIPPHKEMEENSPSPETRQEFARLAFRDIPGAEISDMEIRREGKSYTADTVDILRQRFPEDELCIVMGTDMFLSFKTWFRWQHLVEECTLAVLSREADDASEIAAFRSELARECGARVILMAHEPLPMSSTEIRRSLRLRQGAELVPEAVYARILQTGSYGAKAELSWLRAHSRPYLKPKRVKHVEGVEREAVKLARRWGEDADTAAEAGILHDITKSLPHEKQLKLCEKYGIMLEAAERETPALLHAITGAAFSRELFGISDAVYGAIRWHTTGKPEMSLLEKIVYLADYIEPTRDFEGIKKLRKLSFEDLDAAMALGLKMSLEEIRARGDEPFRDTVDACAWYSRLQAIKEEEKTC